MRIRLRIVGPGGAATSFEHTGPVIHVGRDPACELSLSGADSDGVSRRHARVELAAEGATLADAGSSNGTRLNNALVEKPMPLRVGDRFQLGFTGPTLTVVELDLTAGKPTFPQKSWGAVAAGGVAAAALVVGAALYVNREKPTEIAVAAPSVPPPEKSEPAAPAADDPVTKKVPLQDDPTGQPVEKTAANQERPADVPSAQIEEIGQYLAPSKKLPLGVVLQRPNEQQQWTVLRPGDAVSSGHTLLSLPGYRGALLLKSGVGLVLDGNLPEFSAAPPVLESVLTLHEPADGFHADLTLERGRVRVGSPDARGPAKVRFRFLQEVWDVTLPEGQSEVAAELWYAPELGTFCGLFTGGRIRVQKLRGPAYDLPPKGFLYWQSTAASDLPPATLPELPAWWSGPHDPKGDGTKDVLLSLEDWQKWLQDAGEVTEFIAERALDLQRKDVDSTHRALGIRFLAALERPHTLLAIQNRGEIPERSRRAAADALHRWLSQGPGRRAEFERLALPEYNKPTVEVIVRLLTPAAKEFGEPRMKEQLVEWLDHDRLIVRQLAFWHLERLHWESVDGIGYEPTESDKAVRAAKIKGWRNAVLQK